MANWQTLLKEKTQRSRRDDRAEVEMLELLDKLSPEMRAKYESRMKTQGSKTSMEVKYNLQVEELLSDPKVESMENELESMKEKMDDKATELMRYVWDNEMNPVDEDDPNDDRYGPGFKASEILGKWVEDTQRQFGGYLPW
tara:strand:+ start:336 stop:758 length:423 start_codon:yes stop_codon:yes gene_type:complete